MGDLTASERGRLLLKLSELVRNRIDNLAIIESFDVGKPLKQAKSDALALARYFEFYGGASDKIMGETIPYLKDYTVYTLREPHGVTGTYNSLELSYANYWTHFRCFFSDG